MAGPEEEVVQGKAHVEAGIDQGIDLLTAGHFSFGSQILQACHDILDLVVIEFLLVVVGQ